MLLSLTKLHKLWKSLVGCEFNFVFPVDFLFFRLSLAFYPLSVLRVLLCMENSIFLIMKNSSCFSFLFLWSFVLYRIALVLFFLLFLPYYSLVDPF